MVYIINQSSIFINPSLPSSYDISIILILIPIPIPIHIPISYVIIHDIIHDTSSYIIDIGISEPVCRVSTN